MTDQTDYWQDVFDIFYNNRVPAQDAVDAIKERGGKHLDLAVAFGGMFMMIMAHHDYTDPKEVWEAVANYEDMRNS